MNNNSFGSQAPLFQFIPVQSLGQTTNPASRQLVRSHALKETLKAKRKKEEGLQKNFRCIVSQDPHRYLRKPQNLGGLKGLPSVIAANRIDPFDSLRVDSSRLQLFLRHKASRQAGEPVFSLDGEDSFQSFPDMLRISLDDPALINALMLTLAFAVNGFTVDTECLNYKGEAIFHLNRKIQCFKTAAAESTIFAILLLAGVEARLGLISNVQIHMNGLQKLLELCESQYVHLGMATKRAIFWWVSSIPHPTLDIILKFTKRQDLNSAVMAGSKRIVHHKTFSELAWSRRSFHVSLYTLPKGFIPMSHLFSDEIKAIFEDIHAFQYARDSVDFRSQGSMSTLQLDNQQAWIESRLHESRTKLSTNDDLLECCLVTAYLCTYLTYTDVWHGSSIPEHCASQLLRKLQQMTSTSKWSGKEDLLLWLVCLGGAFARRGAMRSAYSILMNETYHERLIPLIGSWEGVESCLKKFFWSRKAFRDPCKVFWVETCSS